MNYLQLKNDLKTRFLNAGINELADIDWIIVEVTGKSRSMLPFLPDFTENELEKIENLVQKRLKHIPLGLVLGKSNFYGRDFAVTNDTLIPRMDTEVLIEKVIETIKNDYNNGSVPTILDIGTGSGAIAITLKKETISTVYAVDVSEKALAVAKQNAKNLDVEVTFFHSDLFKEIESLKVDIIVSNPPYIKTDIIETLDKEVKDNEPILALDGGKDGLYFYKKIISEAKNHLNSGGRIFFEIGFDQGQDVKNLLETDFENVEIIKDYSLNDRVVCGKLRREKWLKD